MEKDVIQISYVVHENTTDIFLSKIGYEKPKHFTVNSGSIELQEMYDRFFAKSGYGQLLTISPWEFSQYSLFIEPILPYTKPGDILWIVPDGLLHYLPFSAIPLEGQYLIERNALVFTPNITTMAYCRYWRRNVLSGFDFGKKYSYLGIAVGPENDNDSFCSEVQEVSSIDVWNQSCLLRGTEATVKNILKESAKHAVIHFACHGITDPTDPLKSFLLVSDGKNLPAGLNDKDKIDKKFMLRALDILGKEFSADLIILSACWSGRSQLFAGDTLIGLSDVFLGGKCSTLIAAQWEAPDKSIRFLLKQFFHHCFEKKQTKIEALRHSIIDTMRFGDGNWLHPYFWAGLKLIGNWE